APSGPAPAGDARRIDPDGRRELPARLRRQAALPAMADTPVDVAIAGGGPAGATLAILLGRGGFRVDLYEARRFPREKPCGEGIMPGSVAVLERLGLRAEVGGQVLRVVRYHGFGLTAAAPLARAGGSALAQRRLRSDDVLL